MAIKIVVGDLLEAEENILVHQTNCQGVMGSGIAVQIKEKYPIAYEEYVQLCSNYYNDKERLLGKAHVVSDGGKYVANVFGQLSYGRDSIRYTNYHALEEGLKKIAGMAKGEGLSVAIPYAIGCGLGGGRWGIVYKIIEKIFEDCEVTIYKLEEI